MSSPLTVERTTQPPARSGAQPGAAREPLLKGAFRASPRYWVCLALLIVSAVGIQVVRISFGHWLQKQKIDLKAPFVAANPAALAPQYALHPAPPETLSEEQKEGLGTEEYLSWKIVDTRRERRDALRLAHVFITYYSGKPDMVPHVPDECRVAGGGTQVGEARTVEVSVPGSGAAGDRVPLRVVSFDMKPSVASAASARDIVNVLYFFHTNGKYVTTRDQVRYAQANLFERYSYYAKIEIQFSDDSGSRTAGLDESIEAAGPLLTKLLPILLKDHLPDWAKVTQ